MKSVLSLLEGLHSQLSDAEQVLVDHRGTTVFRQQG